MRRLATIVAAILAVALAAAAALARFPGRTLSPEGRLISPALAAADFSRP